MTDFERDAGEIVDEAFSNIRWAKDISSDAVEPEASEWAAIKAQITVLMFKAYMREHEA